jgi:hypothetical protein
MSSKIDMPRKEYDIVICVRCALPKELCSSVSCNHRSLNYIAKGQTQRNCADNIKASKIARKLNVLLSKLTIQNTFIERSHGFDICRMHLPVTPFAGAAQQELAADTEQCERCPE